MNAIDMIYHLATSWAVHLNYVAVKITIIFLSVYLITELVGKKKEQGIVVSILGPFMFYLYYLFANPTIDRAVFTLDEQFWFFFLHVGFMFIAYFMLWYLIQKKQGMWNSLGTLLLSTMAFDLLFLMVMWRVQGIPEDEAAQMLTFGLIWPPFLLLFIAFFIGIMLNKFWVGSVLSSVAMMWLRNVGHGVYIFIISMFLWSVLGWIRRET